MSKKQIIRIGTRSSRLALSQVSEVYLLLSDFLGDKYEIDIIPINTSGDKIQDRNLSEVGGKGLFIKELEEALINNKIDIAVHSAKDIPPILHQDTELAAFPPRLDARDCFISSKFGSLAKLPNASIIGTSSARRKATLLRKRPDLQVVNFRGNVDTRLNKINDGDVDASVLAMCGLIRLEKQTSIIHAIEIDDMIPAGGQGALALQVRKNDDRIVELVKKIDHLETRICIKSERVFLRDLGASCSTPVGVYAHIKNKKLHLETIILDYQGEEEFRTSSSSENISLEGGIDLATSAAKRTLLEAKDLLTRITCK